MPPSPLDLEALIRHSPAPIVVLDPALTIVAANDVYLRTTRVDRSVIGRPIFEVFPQNPDGPEFDGPVKFRAGLERVLANGLPHRMPITRYDLVRPAEEGGGFEERHWDPLSYPVKDEQGRVAYIVHQSEDVTEFVRLRSREAEFVQAMEGADRDLRAGRILETSSDAFFALDRGWQFSYVNRQAQVALRKTASEVIGRVIWDLYPQLAGTEFELAYRRAMDEQEPSSITTFYPEHGRWYEVHSSPSPDGISVRFRDVSERKWSEEEIDRLASESETRRRLYEAALSNTPDLVYIFDLDHRFIYANEALLRMWGRGRDEAVGKTCLELGYEPWHAEMHNREIDQVAASGRPIRGEVPFHGTAGRRYYDYILVPVLDAEGTVVAVAGTTRDVTERREAEQRQTFLAEAGRILGSSLDYEKTLADVCRLAVPVLADWCTLDLADGDGVRRVEVVHMDPEKVALAHEYRRRYPPNPDDDQGLMKVLMTGEPLVYPEITDEILRQTTRDPAQYQMIRELGLKSVILVPLNARGRTLGVLTLVTAESDRFYGPEDVEIASELASRAALAVDNSRLFEEARAAAHEREQALLLHRAVEEQLTLLVEASGSLSASLEPISVLDAVMSLSRELISADAYAIWRLEEATNRWVITAASGLSDRYRQEAIDAMSNATVPTGPVVAEDVQATGSLASRRLEHQREGIVSLLVVPLKVRGTTAGTIAFYFREPHKFSEVEIRVATALSNLASSAIATSELYEALKENDRKKDEFLAMLAHELRNPLSAIGNAVQVLQRSSAGEHLEWAKEVIDKHVHSLSRMIDDLLDVSRITRGKIQLQVRPVDVLAVVAHAVETVRPLIEEKRHRLTLSHASEPMWVEADEHRLEQVLVNLLNNAAKYTEPGGRIELSTQPEGGSIALSVIDNGSGIAPEKIPQMFELFAQGDRSIARSEGGLGIGLTLVRSLVEMHGGRVSARSDGEGAGSEFTVVLPAVSPPSPEREPRPRGVTAGSGRGSRVLVVDDNEDTALGLVRLLKILGHDVETAPDGPSALEAARRHRPEFVLLDIGLPVMDGYQVAGKLRADGFTDAIIIAVSGYGEESARKRSQEAGFDHHLVKPVDYDRLVGIIGRLE